MVLARTHRRHALALAALILALTGCQSGSSTHGNVDRIKSDPNESFSSKVFGVAASPRVTDSRIVRKGGGRFQVGKPYKVRGKWYYPKEQAGYVKTGKASWYGASFHGRLTANGEVYDMFGLSAAHPTFPLPSYARVTNMKTGSTVMVRVNDRGPYAEGRVMDLSSRAAELLGYKQDGIGDIKVEYVGRAPTEGDDTPMLMASYRPGLATRSIDDGMASGVMVATSEPSSSLSFASSMTGAKSPVLPGVRPLQAIGMTTGGASPAAVDPVSVGSIIAASGASSDFGRNVPLPTSRSKANRTIVSSYASADRGSRASEAISAMMTMERPSAERIEIGVLDQATARAVRRIALGHGKLLVDGGADEGASFSFEAAAGENVDALLQAFWHAGAEQAFVLRD